MRVAARCSVHESRLATCARGGWPVAKCGECWRREAGPLCSYPMGEAGMARAPDEARRGSRENSAGVWKASVGVGAAGVLVADDGAPVRAARELEAVLAAHGLGLEGCKASLGKGAPIPSSSRSDGASANERQTRERAAPGSATCARTRRARVSSCAASRGRAPACVWGTRAPRTVSRPVLNTSGRAFSPGDPCISGLLRMDATRLSDGIFDRLRRLQVAEEVLQRARRALCARCAIAG